MEIIEGLKRKFASANCKLIRICTITGNVDKLEKLLTDNKDIDVGKVQHVSVLFAFIICKCFIRCVNIIGSISLSSSSYSVPF